jgi:hypothetical protein
LRLYDFLRNIYRHDIFNYLHSYITTYVNNNLANHTNSNNIIRVVPLENIRNNQINKQQIILCDNIIINNNIIQNKNNDSYNNNVQIVIPYNPITNNNIKFFSCNPYIV